MTIGQISEVLFLLFLPAFFTRFGFKKTILVGMAAWALRYLLFAYGDSGDLAFMLLLGIALHGICYDFFFVTGYMYTERKAGEKIKSAAQGLFTFATYGLGMVIGTWFSGFVADNYTQGTVRNWQQIWLVPAYIALGVLVYFILFFREKRDIKQAA